MSLFVCVAIFEYQVLPVCTCVLSAGRAFNRACLREEVDPRFMFNVHLQYDLLSYVYDTKALDGL